MLETIIALHIWGGIIGHAVAPIAVPLGVQVVAEISDSPDMKRFAKRARRPVSYGDPE